jgi:hypothetical protein
MAKTSVDDWDTSAAANTDIGGINLAEGQMVVSSTNNAFREMMAQLKTKIATLISSTAAVFADNVFFITGSSDATKKLAFEVDGFTTATTRTVTVPDANITMAAINLEDQVITGGGRVTSKDLGTPTNGSTVTLDPGDRPLQHLTNNVAGFTLAPGSNTGSIVLDITNGASAGTITTSGFTKVVGAFDTTSAHKFRCAVVVGNAGSSLSIQGLQ